MSDGSFGELSESTILESILRSSTDMAIAAIDLDFRILIKDGKQDKDIIEILNISLDTVKTHRRNIRKKLGINNKKINLRTKLLTFN